MAVAPAVAFWIAIAAISGCATVSPRTPGPPKSDGDLAGWQALAEGRDADAARVFAARLAGAPFGSFSPIALFGRATLAYERGASVAALDDYAALLTAMPALRDGALVRELAPVAAARVLALYDEVGFAVRARIGARLRPVELSREPALPWLARIDLARLGDHIARQAGDADALVRAATADGCAGSMFEIGSLGPFPHLDLDRASTLGRVLPTGKWRALSVSGCHLDAPLSADGRGEARVLRAAIEVGAGRYEIVVDFEGEARLSVDGGAWVAHGQAGRYGPRLTATRVALAAGRHEITLRTASKAGQTSLGFWVLPDDPGRAARFVDPRDRVATAGPAVVLTETAGAVPGADGPGGRALAAYADAFVADRVGAIDAVAAALERLDAWPRFALGLALGGEIARHDPTRPA
ncbi:MAG TPA: hypothetical protein VIK30_05825, partial [Polyangia bacterium]